MLRDRVLAPAAISDMLSGTLCIRVSESLLVIRNPWSTAKHAPGSSFTTPSSEFYSDGPCPT